MDGGDVWSAGQDNASNHGGAPIAGLEGTEEFIVSSMYDLNFVRALAAPLVPEYLATSGGLVGQGNERYVGRDCHEAEYNDHRLGLGGIAGDARP